MLTLLVAFFAGFAGASFSIYGLHWSVVWGITVGILCLLLTQVISFLLIRRATRKVNDRLQELMQGIQKKLMQKQQQFMRKPVGSQKTMMQLLEKEQASGIEEVLKACELFAPLYKWNFMLKRQVNTMKMVFHYQLKRYDEADALMPRCVFMDPQSISIKMARMYQREDPGLEKFFRKKSKSLKGENCVLPYSLYAWILLKQGKNDEAFQIMTQAKSKTSDETVEHNRELLANGKFKQFSNAALGEQWYALQLEEPRMPKMQQPVYRAR